jgi:hypothetical protein
MIFGGMHGEIHTLQTFYARQTDGSRVKTAEKTRRVVRGDTDTTNPTDW